MNNNTNITNASIPSAGEICRTSPPSSRPVANIMPRQHKILPITSSSSSPSLLGRQLKRLRDANTVKEAQTAILALVPIIHSWIQNNLKNNVSYSTMIEKKNSSLSDPRASIIQALGASETTKNASAGDEFVHDLHGVSILVLALKQWETCPIVVSTCLRILAFLVGKYPPIAQALVEMGGLRLLVKSICEYHSNQNEQVVTTSVALLSELAQHLPATVASDACLALVVHGLWKFPKSGILQGFGCLYFERVLISSSLLEKGTLEPSPPAKSLNHSKNNLGKDNDSTKDDSSSTNNTWKVTTVHQPDTLQKVVVPLLLRMGKFHGGSNQTLSHRAKSLLQSIQQQLLLSNK